MYHTSQEWESFQEHFPLIFQCCNETAAHWYFELKNGFDDPQPIFRLTINGRSSNWLNSDEEGIVFIKGLNIDLNNALLPGEACHSEWCEVRRSGIHGRGVFAVRDIPAETKIIQYLGEIIDKEESDIRGWAQMDRHNETGEAAVYIFTLDENWDIDGGVPQNAARLINHGCEVNCEAYVEEKAEGEEYGSIWIWSVRDIAKDEELLFNYGFDLENWEEHPCVCGAECCPGYIAGSDFWEELKEKIAEKRRLSMEATAKVLTEI